MHVAIRAACCAVRVRVRVSRAHAARCGDGGNSLRGREMHVAIRAACCAVRVRVRVSHAACCAVWGRLEQLEAEKCTLLAVPHAARCGSAWEQLKRP